MAIVDDILKPDIPDEKVTPSNILSIKIGDEHVYEVNKKVGTTTSCVWTPKVRWQLVPQVANLWQDDLLRFFKDEPLIYRTSTLNPASTSGQTVNVTPYSTNAIEYLNCVLYCGDTCQIRTDVSQYKSTGLTSPQIFTVTKPVNYNSASTDAHYVMFTTTTAVKVTSTYFSVDSCIMQPQMYGNTIEYVFSFAMTFKRSVTNGNLKAIIRRKPNSPGDTEISNTTTFSTDFQKDKSYSIAPAISSINLAEGDVLICDIYVQTDTGWHLTWTGSAPCVASGKKFNCLTYKTLNV